MARQTNRKQSGVRMSEITPPRIVAEPQPLHLSLEAPRPSPDGWSMPDAGADVEARRPVVLDLAGDDDSDVAAPAHPGSFVVILSLD